MLEIHVINGRNCPMIVCDMCGQRLESVGKAAAVFENFLPDGAKARVLHVHKGKIDGHTCHEEAEVLLGKNGATIGWEEMKTFLSNLCSNICFSGQDMAAYDERHKDLGI